MGIILSTFSPRVRACYLDSNQLFKNLFDSNLLGLGEHMFLFLVWSGAASPCMKSDKEVETVYLNMWLPKESGTGCICCWWNLVLLRLFYKGLVSLCLL